NLGDGRPYGVLVDCSGASCVTLKLGVEFNAASVIVPAQAAFHFASPHHFETGDSVIYDCQGGSPITTDTGTLTCGGTYTVFKIDENNIRLASGATGGTYTFT